MEGSKARGARFYPSIKMLGNETTLMAKGSTGAITHFTTLNLNDGIKILEPAGTAYMQNDGILVTDEWVVIANQDYIDGIKTLSGSPEDEGLIFNLSGQRLSKMQKGINIVGGRKVFVK